MLFWFVDGLVLVCGLVSMTTTGLAWHNKAWPALSSAVGAGLVIEPSACCAGAAQVGHYFVPTVAVFSWVVPLPLSAGYRAAQTLVLVVAMSSAIMQHYSRRVHAP